MRKFVTGLQTFLFSVVVLVVLAACTPNTPAVTPTAASAPGTFVPQQRNIATLPPPAWVAVGQEIKLANVTNIAYLGRLDAQGSASSTVFAYDFSPDGSRLVGLNNEQIIFWDLITGKLLFNTARQDAAQIYYGADKTEVYTVDSRGQIRVYATDSGQLVQTLQGQTAFNGSADYDANDGYLALGGLDGTVKVWDVKARQSLVTIQAQTQLVKGVAFSSDGSRLATIGDEKMVKVWDWQAKKLITQMSATAIKVVFSPGATQLAIGEDRQISLWSLPDGKSLANLTTGPRAQSDTVLYSPDGQYIVNGGSIQALTVWDAKTGKLVNTLPGAGGDVNTAAFSHEGDLLVTSVLGGDVNLWDVSTMRSVTMNRATLSVGSHQILYADWSPDGFILLLGDATGPLEIWGIAAPATPTPEATATPTG
ncbi:MAG: WD40 repeat domain-containing protein [Anaerolineae bacterium]|nr:WD40 repeat domain-containing protein [Anaerolineae bacterium]